MDLQESKTLNVINNVSSLFIRNEELGNDLDGMEEIEVTTIDATIGPLPEDNSQELVREPMSTSFQVDASSMVDFINLPIESVSWLCGGGTVISFSEECDIEISQLINAQEISYMGETAEFSQVIIKRLVEPVLYSDS